MKKSLLILINPLRSLMHLMFLKELFKNITVYYFNACRYEPVGKNVL